MNLKRGLDNPLEERNVKSVRALMTDRMLTLVLAGSIGWESEEVGRFMKWCDTPNLWLTFARCVCTPVEGEVGKLNSHSLLKYVEIS